jgi:hypothetical protein
MLCSTRWIASDRPASAGMREAIVASCSASVRNARVPSSADSTSGVITCVPVPPRTWNTHSSRPIG